jgi:molybdopterin converting factor small subunit
VSRSLVTVELFGLARLRAGVAEVRADGRTVADLLRSVVRQCPQLTGLVSDRGDVSRQYLVSIDGDRFIADTAEPIPAGCRLLILGADPGG